MMIVPRLLSAGLMGGLTIGLTLLLAWELGPNEPPPAPLAREPARAIQVPAVQDDTPDEDALSDASDALLARPMFSASRRPAATSDHETAMAADAPKAGLPRLTGVIVGPSERLALFTDTGGKLKTLAEGETLDDYTVQSIEPGSVVLDGPDGERTLSPAFLKQSQQTKAK